MTIPTRISLWEQRAHCFLFPVSSSPPFFPRSFPSPFPYVNVFIYEMSLNASSNFSKSRYILLKQMLVKVGIAFPLIFKSFPLLDWIFCVINFGIYRWILLSNIDFKNRSRFPHQATFFCNWWKPKKFDNLRNFILLDRPNKTQYATLLVLIYMY